jgi:hypothetical protein
MTDGLLENIIQLEKRIQTEVAAEQVRADEWQKRELAALQNSFTEAQATEKERCRQILTEKRAGLLREGIALEADSSTWCNRLSSLDETTLRDVLKRHLAAILPGGDHDHPHGQG